MRFIIEHTINYRYSQAVFLEPLIIRLTPLASLSQRCEDFSLTVAPDPAGIAACLDVSGHPVHSLWFERLYTQLTITARSRVEVFRDNPFGFIITEPGARSLPVEYNPQTAQALAPCRQASPPEAPLLSLVAQVRRESQDRTTDFLMLLCQRLRRNLQHVHRPTGDPWPAGETIVQGEGACRDLAVVFIEACRQVGLAARFVSGYRLEPDQPADSHDLHAWAEVYLPGGGWRGYDPTLGQAVAGHHVILTAAPYPGLAAPVSGTFLGTGAQSQITASVSLRPLAENG